MQTTDIEKIVLNSGVNQAITNQQFLENTEKLIQKIGQGQKPVRTRAKKSIVSFKLREGMPIGINDLNIFPETTYDLTFKNQGCQVIIVFTSSSTEENAYFLELLHFPFSKAH
ncbi:9274_t:CDS:2 [Entrophospora sp. SA101]|nr:12679_t:CDS:2 [Entrophospora sp. SA101]CAJ0761714.1 9274_t:CDS:2 [Entrophospora sp. SA101]CAJ0858684.1 18464_t:CDS:2 [Entrophospora sp. SA101]CAJ0909860.1 5181_t:CDS:2 [Entrophospora sp. SA101]